MAQSFRFRNAHAFRPSKNTSFSGENVRLCDRARVLGIGRRAAATAATIAWPISNRTASGTSQDLLFSAEMANDDEGSKRGAGDGQTDTDQRGGSASGLAAAAEWITALSECRIHIGEPCSGESAPDNRIGRNTKNRTHETSPNPLAPGDIPSALHILFLRKVPRQDR